MILKDLFIYLKVIAIERESPVVGCTSSLGLDLREAMSKEPGACSRSPTQEAVTKTLGQSSAFFSRPFSGPWTGNGVPM